MIRYESAQVNEKRRFCGKTLSPDCKFQVNQPERLALLPENHHSRDWHEMVMLWKCYIEENGAHYAQARIPWHTQHISAIQLRKNAGTANTKHRSLKILDDTCLAILVRTCGQGILITIRRGAASNAQKHIIHYTFFLVLFFVFEIFITLQDTFPE